MDTGQGAGRYSVEQTNPNDLNGGGGCFCSEGRCTDRGGPYFVSLVTETDSNASPRVVICAPCVGLMTADLERGVEGAASFDPVIEGEAELIVETNVPAHENPVAEDDYPVLTREDDDQELVI